MSKEKRSKDRLANLIESDNTELVAEFDLKIPLNKTQSIRKFIIQILYQRDSQNDHIKLEKSKPTNNLGIISTNLSKKEISFCENIALKINQTKNGLDEEIHNFAEEYPTNQLSLVDKNILRLAFWEVENQLTECNNQELVDDFEKLGYLFGSDKSDKFVRGVIRSLTINGRRKK